MRELDEDTALAILFGNTKKKKRAVDLLTLAESCEFLIRKYGSTKRVAEKIGLSTEMIREIVLPLKLPKEVQNLISDRKIDSIDIIKEIYRLKDSSKQIEAATILSEVPSKDLRDIVRMIKNTNIGIEDAKSLIFELKPRGLHIILIDVDDEMYKSIKNVSMKLNISLAVLVKGIISSWINLIEERSREK